MFPRNLHDHTAPRRMTVGLTNDLRMEIKMHTKDGWTLVQPTIRHAALVAAWSRSAQEAGYWCSSAHPFPSTAITAWWENDDVRPCLLIDPEGTPVAYGELWDDEIEDETELARLIVDPARRGTGAARRLVDGLLALARTDARSTCIIRVAPGNDDVLGVYRLAGFRDVDDVTAAEWNQEQPTEYRWLEHSDFPTVIARSA